MRQLTRYELLEEVIIGVSSKINKKALRCVLEESYINDDLNEILFNYYLRKVNSQQRFNNMNNNAFVEFIYIDDFDNKEEFNADIKACYGAKIYKQDYNYKTLGKIRQRHTGMIYTMNNGWNTHSHYCFNVYEYIRVNEIEVV